MEKMKNTL